MKYSKFLVPVFLTLNFTVFSVGCIDKKNSNPTNDTYATLNGPSLKPASSAQLSELAKSIKLGAKKSPCGPAALRRSLFESVIKNKGVPYTQLAPLLSDLTDPDSKDCDGNSCAMPFGIKTYEVQKFLKDSKKAAELLGHDKPGISILRASLTQPPTGGEWAKPDKSLLKIITGKGTVTVYTYQKQADFKKILGKEVNFDNRLEANALAEALLLKKMMYGKKNKSDINGFAWGGGLYAATDPTMTPRYGNVLVAFDIPLNAYYALDKSGDFVGGDSRKDIIEDNQFGIIYPYHTQGKIGLYSVVLRFDSEAHPSAQPIIPGSVRVYKNSYDNKGVEVKLTDQDLSMIRNSNNPARDFMDRFGDSLGQFDLQGGLFKDIYKFLRNDLFHRNVLREFAESQAQFQFEFHQNREFYLKRGLKVDDADNVFINDLISRFLDNSGKTRLSMRISIAKAMGALSQSSEPKDMREFEIAISQYFEFKLRGTEIPILNFKVWSAVLDDWKKNNLDAFVNRTLNESSMK